MVSKQESRPPAALYDHFVTDSLSAEWVLSDIDGLFNLGQIKFNLPTCSIGEAVDEIQMADELKNGDHMDKVNKALELARSTGRITHLLHAYTIESIFYRKLNRTLANRLPSKDFAELLSDMDASKNGTYVKARVNWALYYASTIIRASLSPEFPFKSYFGRTYGGINITEQDLLVYHVNSFIIPKTFTSTSKNRSLAEAFASSPGDGQISAICTYVLDSPNYKSYAIDLEDISAFPDEEEVLIMPFNMFMISKIDRTSHNNIIEIEITVPTKERIDLLDLNGLQPSESMMAWGLSIVENSGILKGIFKTNRN